MKNVKLIVSDIDGVWTNGEFYYSNDGDIIRKFTTRDSYGVSLCRLASIPIVEPNVRILTALSIKA